MCILEVKVPDIGDFKDVPVIEVFLIVCTQAQTPEQILRKKEIGPLDLARCAEPGAALAAGLSLGVF